MLDNNVNVEQTSENTSEAAESGENTANNIGVDLNALTSVFEKLIDSKFAALERKNKSEAKKVRRTPEQVAADESPEGQLKALKAQLEQLNSERQQEKEALKAEKAKLRVSEVLTGKVNATAARLITKDIMEKVTYSEVDGEPVIVAKNGEEVLLADYVTAALKGEYSEFVIVKQPTNVPARRGAPVSQQQFKQSPNGGKLSLNDQIALLMGSDE